MIQWDQMGQAVYETVYMTVITTIFVTILGLLIGSVLFFTRPDGLEPHPVIHKILNGYVNITRALPFVIFLLILMPVTRAVIGTIFGPNAALPALILGAAPFYARMVELAFREIDRGVIEAAESLGARRRDLIMKVLFPEAMPALISGLTVTVVTLIGYTALAGVIGAGGLGNLAYLFGFQRSNYAVMWTSTGFILILVFAVQWLGDCLAKLVDKR